MRKILLLFCFVYTIQTYGQNELSINKTNTDYSFDEIVPKLSLLSAFAKKNIDINEIKVIQKKKSSQTTIVGRVITTSLLKEKLGKHHFADYNKTWSEPTLKNLQIHADSLILDGDIELPECNIYVHARIVQPNGYSIRTTPLDFHKTLTLDKASKGRNGRKGGDITLKTFKIVPSNSPFWLATRGSDGENRYLPKLSIEPPKSPGRRDVYKNQGCEEQGSNSHKTRFDWNTVAVWYDNADCNYYKSYDDFIKFDRKDKGSSIIRDTKTDRLKYTMYTPGDGGASGNIIVSYQEDSKHSFSTSNLGGSKGKYKDGRDRESSDRHLIVYLAPTWEYQKDKEYFSIQQQDYNLYRYKVSGMWVIDVDKKELIQSIKIPSDEAIRKLKEGLRDTWASDGNKGKKNVKMTSYLPSEIYQNEILKGRYKDYHNLDKKTKASLQEEHDFLLSCSLALLNDNLTTEEEINAYSCINNILELLNTTQLDVDEFGNGPGYRPMLSINSLLSYMNEEDAIKQDIKTYILADLASKEEIDKGTFFQEIPERITSLKNQLEGLEKDLKSLEEDSVRIVNQAKKVAEATEDIQKEFERIGAIIKKTSGREKMIHDGSKALLKAGALAASVIPYGQPALGAVVGNGLLALSEEIKIDGSSSGSEIGLRVLSKIDYATVVQDLGSQMMLTELEWTKKNQPKNKSKILELTRKAEENAKKAKEAADKLEEKNFENYKRNYAKYASYATKGTQKAQDIFRTYANNSTSSAENDEFFSRLASRHTLYQDLVKKLKDQNEKKEKLYDELSVVISKAKALNKKYVEIPRLIMELNELWLYNDKFYSANLESLYSSMAENALSRIMWAEYQLIKTYEYTTLKVYENTGSNTLGFLQEYDRYLNENKNSIDAQKIDPFVDHMALYMKSLPRSITQTMLKEVKNNIKEDKQGEEVRITSLAEGNEWFVNPKLEELNSPYHYYSATVDLQQDLIQSVISSDRDAIRIKKIVLDDIKFDKPLKGKITFSIEVGKDGVLKNGDEFYYFNPDTDDYAMKWSWSINSKGEIINSSQPAKEFVDLMNQLTNQKALQEDANGTLFALPPAWSKLKLKVLHRGSISDDGFPKVTDLRFRVITTYKDAQNRGVKTLDVKQLNNLDMLGINVKIDTVKHMVIKGLYTTFSPGTELTFSVTQDSSLRKFERWAVYGDGGVIDKKMLSNRTITLKANEDLRVVAIFEEPKSEIPRSASEEPMIDVFSSASDNAEPIIQLKASQIVKLEDKEKDGYQKVLIGIEEGYIKE